MRRKSSRTFIIRYGQFDIMAHGLGAYKRALQCRPREVIGGKYVPVPVETSKVPTSGKIDTPVLKGLFVKRVLKKDKK